MNGSRLALFSIVSRCIPYNHVRRTLVARGSIRAVPSGGGAGRPCWLVDSGTGDARGRRPLLHGRQGAAAGLVLGRVTLNSGSLSCSAGWWCIPPHRNAASALDSPWQLGPRSAGPLLCDSDSTPAAASACFLESCKSVRNTFWGQNTESFILHYVPFTPHFLFGLNTPVSQRNNLHDEGNASSFP